ncbi:hypothetical protein HDU87_004039 [Geranomyces variabilis]|uniref:Uncharacterized protein n=1 Tax=Geranomyces variabilis TaxID=109894 RepID=A0AAD5TQW1_9FUNG|nr:hypothetical protein HDU87_004039 [Geranomyces variabilis]
MTSTLKPVTSILLALATASTLFHTSSTSLPLRSLIAAVPLAVSALSLLSGRISAPWTIGEILTALVAAGGVWLRTAAVNELDAFFGYKTTIEKGLFKGPEFGQDTDWSTQAHIPYSSIPLTQGTSSRSRHLATFTTSQRLFNFSFP